MNYKSFNVKITNKIAHIQLSRPEQLNSMNTDFWTELPECIENIDSTGLCRVIVLSSTGKHFSAGMDLAVFNDSNALPLTGEFGRVGENLRRIIMQLQNSLSTLEKVRVPVLSAIQGGCIGGALDMVCATDSRYCTQDAFFSIKETEIGMTADVGTLQRLPKLMPEGIVRELAFTGRKFTAQEAKKLGFVNHIFSDQKTLIIGVMAIAEQIAKNSPLAVTGCKEMINYSRDHNVEDSLKYMATWQSGMFRSNDLDKSFKAKTTDEPPLYDKLWPRKKLFVANE